MIRSYLVVAWRNLVRHKIYSFINITGLAIGLAVCMLIVLYVGHESSYDLFHKNADRIYKLQTKLKIGTDSVFMPYLNYSAAPMVSQREPSVESFLRVRDGDRSCIIQNTDKPSLKFSESQFIFADSNFFSFFSFPLLQGNKEQVLRNPLTVVISSRAAQKYFGHEEPVGKTIRYNNGYDMLVTGVAANAASNSSIEFDFVASLSSLVAIKEQADLVKREKSDFTTYFLMKPGATIARVETALFQMAKAQENDEEFSSRFISIPLKDLHLSTSLDTANLKYLKLFPFVAAIVLLLALINYMSLSTARATIRAKEIGVRKVMGAGRKMIAGQFFAESVLYTAIAFVLGYFVCVMVQPFFFIFLQIEIDHSFFYDPKIIISFLGLFVVTALVASAYPSIVLSSFNPVVVLYGKFKQLRGISLRKFFTVFQFTIAVIFIICGLLIHKQIFFFRQMDTGINRDNVVMVPFGQPVSAHYSAFREEIRSVAGIDQYSIALHPMFKGYDMMGVTPPGSQQMMLMPVLDVDQHFISLLGLKWKQAPSDSFFYAKKKSVILNETAVTKLNLGQQALNQKIDDFEVAGVLRDFNWSSPQHKIEGLLITVSTDQDTTTLWSKKGGCFFAKISAGANVPAFMEQLKLIHNKYDAENPFEFYFMDEAFDSLYKAEDRLARILSSFTILSILIAGLGLFGLVTFIAVQRNKEIGIRKTLGASVGNIVQLLTGDFMKLVVISVLIASPIAWFFMNKWLQDFAYRVRIEWPVFFIAAFIAILIALLTISFQAVKAAMANPVTSLRSE